MTPRRIAILWLYGDANPAWRWRGAEIWQRALEDAAAPNAPPSSFHIIDATDMLTPLPLAGAFDGFVLTGSPFGVYENEPWIHRMLAFVRSLAALPTPPRVLGGCFGAQLLAHALGGRVEPTPPFQLAATEMRLHGDALASFPWAAPLRGLPAARLLESHGDACVALPPRAVPLAGSERCAHEMFCVVGAAGAAFGLAIQAHPEFTVEGEIKGVVIKRRLERALMTEAEAAAVEATFALPRHEAAVLQAARLFLDGV
jgi:GMP synthase-like glutamine amidotransferase